MIKPKMVKELQRYWKDMNKLLILIFTLFLTACMMPGSASGEDKVGQGDVVDLTDSKPKEGVVFAVCIFAVGEDGTKYLVDHRHAENMGECIKKRREAVNKYKDPKHRELMGGTRFMFMCDKVRAEVEILEDGTWHINKILGRYDPAYKKKKSYN